jgi:hypothetical protein
MFSFFIFLLRDLFLQATKGRKPRRYFIKKRTHIMFKLFSFKVGTLWNTLFLENKTPHKFEKI